MYVLRNERMILLKTNFYKSQSVFVKASKSSQARSRVLMIINIVVVVVQYVKCTS